LNFAYFSENYKKKQRKIDLPPHALRMQNLKFWPFVDPEHSRVKIEFFAFFRKISKIIIKK